MTYTHNTPQEAIIALENAYSNRDLKGIIDCKDFVSEARLILSSASYDYDLNDNELVLETAKLLEVSLIKYLQDEGYPNFKNVERQFSEVRELDNNLFCIEETLKYQNGETYTNNVYLSIKNGVWKVVSTD